MRPARRPPARPAPVPGRRTGARQAAWAGSPPGPPSRLASRPPSGLSVPAAVRASLPAVVRADVTRCARREQRLDQRRGGRRHPDPELGAQPLLQPGELLQRRRRVARLDQYLDEAGRGGLLQPVQRGAAARPGERGRRVPRGPRPVRQFAQRGRDVTVQFLPGVDDPVVIEFLQQFGAAQGNGRLRLAVRDQPPDLPQIHVQARPGQRDRVPIGAEIAAKVRPQRRAERPERAAQAGPRAGVQDVGPEKTGQPGARMPAGMQHKPRQQRAGPAAGRQLRLRSAEPHTQLPDHLNLSHDAGRWASCGAHSHCAATASERSARGAEIFALPP